MIRKLVPDDAIDIINYGTVAVVLGTTIGFVLGNIDLTGFVAVNAAATATMAAALKMTKSGGVSDGSISAEDGLTDSKPKVP